MIKNDTIAAISTAMQTAAVGVVRVSGNYTFNIIGKLFKASNKTGTENFLPGKLYLGEFYGGGFIDKCMCVIFKEPHSYTGEDMAEIHCHGGMQVVKGVLTAVLNNGARLAGAGEFTRRAFINGKMDLSGAEGIIEMIEASSKAELNAASKLAGGELYKKTVQYQQNLTDIISHLEVLLDYPEEDLEAINISELKSGLNNLYNNLTELVNTYSSGKMLKDGIELVICGVTNAGKSSLINRLLNYDRSIVTEIEGTTRDTIEELLEINGVKFKIVDTAGIRENAGVIESLGIERSLNAIKSAGLILYVIDPETYSSPENKIIKDKIKDKNVITVLNKSDLKTNLKIPCDIEISAKLNQNIDKLKEHIIKTVNLNNISDSLILISERHFNALQRAATNLYDCMERFEEKSFDIIAFELKEIWDILGEISGTTATEEIIDNIFAKFCLGK